MAEAPTKEIAIGRKTVLLATFSPVADNRSAKTATAIPITTVTAGTTSSHRTLLTIELRNASLLKMTR